MRRRITAAAILSLAALSLVPAQTAATTDPSGHPDTCDGAGLAHHVVRAKSLTRRSFDLKRWQDATPVKAAEKRKRSAHKTCLERRAKRKYIGRFVDKKAEQFREYRQQQLALQALLPYDCGSAGSFAIPCYVVACESGYDWGALNPSSGAFSPYQLLPSTYAGVCETCDRSEADIHLAASRVWARSGGAEWVCA